MGILTLLAPPLGRPLSPLGWVGVAWGAPVLVGFGVACVRPLSCWVGAALGASCPLAPLLGLPLLGLLRWGNFPPLGVAFVLPPRPLGCGVSTGIITTTMTRALVAGATLAQVSLLSFSRSNLQFFVRQQNEVWLCWCWRPNSDSSVPLEVTVFAW